MAGGLAKLGAFQPRMNNDTRWLARLGIDQGLFTRPQALQIRAKIGDDADIMSFAQELIDSGVVSNVETLEKIAELAVAKGEKGAPASDPFDASGTSAPSTPGRNGKGTAQMGYLHCGAHGAGHFVKMVHNGIEYGLMAAYAEGLNVIHRANAGNDTLDASAEVAPTRRPET